MGCHTICINQTMNIMGRITTAMSVFMGIRPNFKNNFRSGILDHRKGFWAVSGQKSAAILAMVMFLISAMGMAQTVDYVAPDYDVYLQNGNPQNFEVLRVQQTGPNRDIFFMFDLATIQGQGTITEMELQLTVYDDSGFGEVKVYKGTGTNWNESTLSNTNKPTTASTPLWTFTGNHALDDLKTADIPTSAIEGDLLVLVIKQTSGNDVGFAANAPEVSGNTYTLAPLSKRPKLKVTYNPNSSNVAVTGVSVNPTGLNLDIGNTGQLTESVAPNNATNQTVSWVSSDTAVATVDTAGLVTAVASGIATITVTSQDGGQTAQATVTVTDPNTPPTTGGFWTQTGSDISYTAGHVGIGTAPRSLQMLAVAGEIIATRVRVEEQPNWPDYVFNQDYRLPSLEEVQEHIEANGHLINIPSAADVAANGMDLGEMNRLLLEKVEELTLYLLQQEEQRKELQARLEVMENKQP